MTRPNNTCNEDEKLVYQTSNDVSGIELLEELISNEENYVANILLKCLKLCPSAFGKQSSKADIIKLVTRGTRVLWTQVGSTLEHVVLWWSNAPLACRPSACAKYLRDWLLIIQSDGIIMLHNSFFIIFIIEYDFFQMHPNQYCRHSRDWVKP